MVSFQDMLRKRPIDPEILDEKVRKMEEEAHTYQETRAYEEMAPELNAEAQARKASRRKRFSDLREEE